MILVVDGLMDDLFWTTCTHYTLHTTHTTVHTHPYTTPSPRDRQDGVGTQAYLSSPTGLAVSKGNDKLYVDDYSNKVIRVVYVNYNLLRCAPI